jgi:hypothetical protein
MGTRLALGGRKVRPMVTLPSAGRNELGQGLSDLPAEALLVSRLLTYSLVRMSLGENTRYEMALTRGPRKVKLLG